jgi:hypothetical protein
MSGAGNVLTAVAASLAATWLIGLLKKSPPEARPELSQLMPPKIQSRWGK